MYRVGCVASIKQIVKVHGNVRRILVAGEKRAEIEYLQDTPFLHADIRVIPDKESEDAKEIFGNDLSSTAMQRGLKDIFNSGSCLHGL